MSQPELPPSSTDDLQFDTAEPGNSNASGAVPGQNCVVCSQAIVSTYFALGDKLLCPACCAQASAPPAGSKLGRFVKASFMGLGAGLVGALIWFVIRRVSGWEIGLVAIVVGLMVGAAVRKGSGGRGGRGYQVLAVLLTYCCIAANYMPDIIQLIIKADREQRAQAAANAADKGNAQAPDAKVNAADAKAGDQANLWDPKARPLETPLGRVLLVIFAFGVSLALPFTAGIQNLIGLLIIGFALWEAWKINARRPLPISGPYQMGTGAPA